MEKLYLGVDLGGTNIAAGLTDSAGTLLKKESVPTPRGTEQIVEAITGLCDRLTGGETAASLGVGVPGTVWPKGTVSYACNIDMKKVPLEEMLREKLRLPVHVENDANCAALGEYFAGAGKGAASLLCVTLGTGVGGGFVENGRLFRGFNGCGAEMGHMVIRIGGKECACGRRGCFERYASVTALIEGCLAYIAEAPGSACAQIAARQGKVDGHTAFLAMEAGDAGAEAVFQHYVTDLACGLTNLVNIFQPEVLCVGGGISARGETLLAPVREIVERENYARDCPARFTLTAAKLGGDAGIIGAALLERAEKG